MEELHDGQKLVYHDIEINTYDNLSGWGVCVKAGRQLIHVTLSDDGEPNVTVQIDE